MKKSFLRLVIVAAVSPVIGPAVAGAWGNTGHEAIGDIAEQYLTPKARQAVLDILGPEDLALASTWPDSVRDNPDFEILKPYHIMQVRTGYTYATKPKADLEEKDAVTVLEKYPAILQDPKVPRSVKLVALRYLMHVIGDVHQPLHVGNNLDYGGNSCVVKWSQDIDEAKLHNIWDGRLLDLQMKQLSAARTTPVKYYGSRDYAEDLIKVSALTPAKIKKIQEADYQEWIQESVDVRSSVYPDASPLSDERQRPYCAGGEKDPSKKVDRAQIPVLSDAYKNKAVAIVQSRLVNAGLRLAGTLNKIFAGKSEPGPNPSLKKEEIFKQLDLKN